MTIRTDDGCHCPETPMDAANSATASAEPSTGISRLESRRPALDMHFAGILLLLAFMLPVHTESGWEFPNIANLGQSGFAETFFLVFPLTAGLVLLALANLRRPGWLRGCFLMVLGLLPFAVILASSPFLETVLFFIAFFLPFSPLGSLIFLGAGFLGFFALYTGLRGAIIQPGERVFRRFALGGAGFMLVLQFLPTRIPNAYSWGEPVTLPLIAVPFHLLGQCRDLGHWIIVLGKTAGLALFLLCLYRAFELNVRKRSPVPRRTALQGFVSLWAGYLAELFPLLIVVLFQSREEAFYEAAAFLKVLVWLAGLTLIVPVGLVDFLLGVLPPAAREPSPPTDPGSA